MGHGRSKKSEKLVVVGSGGGGGPGWAGWLKGAVESVVSQCGGRGRHGPEGAGGSWDSCDSCGKGNRPTGRDIGYPGGVISPNGKDGIDKGAIDAELDGSPADSAGGTGGAGGASNSEPGISRFKSSSSVMAQT